MENKPHISEYDEEINLKELFGILRAGSIKIAVITTIFAIISVIYAMSLPNLYKATAILAPAQADSSDLSGLGQMSGLASLTGISMGGESSEAQIAQEIMKSWNFVESFIIENNISVEVYAAEGWNRGSNQLQIDSELFDPETQTWLVENIHTGKAGPPSSWQLFQSFSERLSVSEDIEMGLTTVSIEHYSPILAKQWLDMYVKTINSHMQQRQIEKVSNNINYLQIQLNKTSIAEMREIFYSIIEDQMKDRMVAEASPYYAFVEISPSMVPEIKSQPSRAIISILGTFFGAIFSIFTVLALHYGKKFS